MIGQTLSHYRILEQIGEGGMGVVYKAEDLRLGRLVALKVLPLQATREEEARKRFTQEARHASSLDHPNICPIHAIEETPEGGLFIVMGLVEGKSLRECLKGGPLPWERAMHITAQILAALGHAHAKGLVHRDIKPANVMVNAQDEVKVVDFGLAKATGADDLTRSGVVMGTAQYLSPEQVSGKPVDPRSDLWAVGMVLYEMLTNRPAFKGDGFEATLAAILHGEAQAPSSLVAGLPPALDFIIERALQKDPRLRYQSAENFSQDLLAPDGGSTATLPLSNRGAQARTQPMHGPRRPRRWPMPTAVAAVLLGTGSLLLFLHGRKAPVLQENKVAIALFEDRTGDASQAMLSRLAAERIAEAIAQTGAAETSPLMVSLPLADTENASGSKALRNFAERAGAGLVITGAYHLNGDELQVQAQLFDAKLMKVVALVKPEHASKSHPDEVLDEVAQRLASGVAGRILDPYLDPERVVIPPKYPAYKEWLVGWELYWNSRPGAEERFAKAVQLDPDLLVARIPIAFIHFSEEDYDGVRAQFVLLDKGLEGMNTLDRCMVENARAWMEGHHDAALGPIREAARLAPGSPLVNHQHAYTALYTNHSEEAVAAATRPIRWEKMINARVPVGGDTAAILGWAYHQLGRYDLEQEAARKALEIYPENAKVRAHLAWAAVGQGRVAEAGQLGRDLITTAPDFALEVAVDLRLHGHREASIHLAQDTLDSIQRKLDAGSQTVGLHLLKMQALYLIGHLEESMAEDRELLRSHANHPRLLGHLGVVLAELGKKEEAKGVMEQLSRMPRKDQLGRISLFQAHIAAHLGEKEQALTLLREATDEGQTLGNVRHLDVDFEGLYGYPPFDEFIRPKH